MELDDCAFPLLVDMVLSDDPMVAFKDANWILLVGSKPRGPGMERADLLKDNGKIFIGQGQISTLLLLMMLVSLSSVTLVTPTP